jgi:histidine triad (HIT) family protein
MTQECIFCKIVRGEVKTEIIAENENFIAFPDANPKVEGHTLIVSKKHFVNLMDMPSSMAGEMIDLVKKVAEMKMKRGFEGFNTVVNNFSVAGQVVMHAHLHFLPRKKDDGFFLNL